jgi:hypothetical protein
MESKEIFESEHVTAISLRLCMLAVVHLEYLRLLCLKKNGFFLRESLTVPVISKDCALNKGINKINAQWSLHN